MVFFGIVFLCYQGCHFIFSINRVGIPFGFQWVDYTQKLTITTLALKLSVSVIFYPWVTATGIPVKGKPPIYMAPLGYLNVIKFAIENYNCRPLITR